VVAPVQFCRSYNAIKNEPYALIQKLKYHAVRHSEEYYHTLRSKQPSDLVDIAARFLYLNKTCFNELYRVNSKWIFNTLMGRYNNPNIVQQENIVACHHVLQNADVFFGDFTIAITPKTGDFVYFDPPYHPTDELSFTKYVKQNFTEKDQIRLRDFIVNLHKRGVYIMLSNSKTKFIEDIYHASYFRHHIVRAPRFVNCKPNGRGEVKELLITNYSI
jgi:DNA adenine methylase